MFRWCLSNHDQCNSCSRCPRMQSLWSACSNLLTIQFAGFIVQEMYCKVDAEQSLHTFCENQSCCYLNERCGIVYNIHICFNIPSIDSISNNTTIKLEIPNYRISSITFFAMRDFQPYSIRLLCKLKNHHHQIDWQILQGRYGDVSTILHYRSHHCHLTRFSSTMKRKVNLSPHGQ